MTFLGKRLFNDSVIGKKKDPIPMRIQNKLR